MHACVVIIVFNDVLYEVRAYILTISYRRPTQISYQLYLTAQIEPDWDKP
jgi:hypothetical protein